MYQDKFYKLSKAAQGLAAADLVLKNGKIINVFTGEIITADLALTNGIIVGVGQYQGKEEIDVADKFVSPGFIDAHLHFESSLVTIGELVNFATSWGTTTYIVDPHESVNVSGPLALDYILDQIEQVVGNIFMMLPSCVPAAPGEDNGAIFTAADMEPYLKHPNVLGLGEVMDYRAVIQGVPAMMDKLSLFEDRIIDGHAPDLTDPQLAAYALAGITTDHEAYDFNYAMKQVRNGLQVLIREGSAARNLTEIINGIVEHSLSTTNFSFCTDDKHIEDIRNEGHISYNIKKAIALGLEPIKAIQMATINTAKCYGLKHLGAIAPGYQGDLVILDDLESVSIDSVYFKGKLVADQNRDLCISTPRDLTSTINIRPISLKDLKLKVSDNPEPVIQVIDHQIVTKLKEELLPHNDHIFTPTVKYNKVAVVERHRATGKIGLAVLTGFGINGGAIGSSVAHDSHNIIVVGDNDQDLLLAVKELERVQGGYTIIKNGEVVETLPLPIMGLFTDQGYDHVQPKLQKLIDQAYQLGVSPNIDPFSTLSFLALPVIPEVRVTTNGLYNVTINKYISLN